MKRWLLLYDVVPDYVERRGEYREEHLRLANESAARGELELGGAFGDFDSEPWQVAGAALAFHTDDRSVVETFARNDPYVRNGIAKWRVVEWKVVVGSISTSNR